jgi:hypothetical protein
MLNPTKDDFKAKFDALVAASASSEDRPTLIHIKEGKNGLKCEIRSNSKVLWRYPDNFHARFVSELKGHSLRTWTQSKPAFIYERGLPVGVHFEA